MERILPVIWEGDQPLGLRPINTTGKSGVRAEIVSSDEQLLQRGQHKRRPRARGDPYAAASLEAGCRTAFCPLQQSVVTGPCFRRDDGK